MSETNFTGDADFDHILSMCKATLVTKGRDYTLGKGVPGSDRADRLHNFYATGQFLGLTPFTTLGVYFYKHVAAVFTFLKKGQVESEPIEGRIVDCVNYLLLLYKMILHERRLPAPVVSGSNEGLLTLNQTEVAALKQVITGPEGIQPDFFEAPDGHSIFLRKLRRLGILPG